MMKSYDVYDDRIMLVIRAATIEDACKIAREQYDITPLIVVDSSCKMAQKLLDNSDVRTVLM